MFVSVVEAELRLPGVRNLKAKRKVLNSLRDRIHRRLRVSIAEVDGHDAWQRAVLGIAIVHGQAGEGETLIDSIRRMMDQVFEIEVVRWDVDMWSPLS